MVTFSRPSSRITRSPTATTPARLRAALAGRSRRLTGARRGFMNAIVTNMFVDGNRSTSSPPRPPHLHEGPDLDRRRDDVLTCGTGQNVTPEAIKARDGVTRPEER